MGSGEGCLFDPRTFAPGWQFLYHWAKHPFIKWIMIVLDEYFEGIM